MSNVEPSQPFWQGHKRSPEITDRLITALSDALRENPQFRLGQLLLIVIGDKDVWNTWDETWITALEEGIHYE